MADAPLSVPAPVGLSVAEANHVVIGAPRSAPAARAPATAAAPVESPTSEPTDTATALAELDQLDADLKRRHPRPSADPAPPPKAPPAAPAGEPGEVLGKPESDYSPYLEEHLGLASASLVEIGQGLHAIDQQWRELRTVTERLERQMEGAAQEVEFLRQRAGEESVGTVARGPLISASETLAARSAALGGATPAPYERYTAERYRKTVSAVKLRRRPLAVWTLGLAALISGTLLTFTYLAHTGTPPLWLALLPLIWLIPAPFFVVSFVATQRIVAQNSLDLAGAT
jgi:hypothetical protein